MILTCIGGPYFMWGLFTAKKYLNCSINFYASYSGCNLGFPSKKISANEMLFHVISFHVEKL